MQTAKSEYIQGIIHDAEFEIPEGNAAAMVVAIEKGQEPNQMRIPGERNEILCQFPVYPL